MLTLRDIVEQAAEYLEKAQQTSDHTLGLLREAQSQSKPEPVTVGACPVECIREVLPDGSMILIGGIWCKRCERGEFLGSQGPKVVDWEEREELREDNEALELGDPDIVWSIKGEQHVWVCTFESQRCYSLPIPKSSWPRNHDGRDKDALV